MTFSISKAQIEANNLAKSPVVSYEILAFDSVHLLFSFQYNTDLNKDIQETLFTSSHNLPILFGNETPKVNE